MESHSCLITAVFLCKTVNNSNDGKFWSMDACVQVEEKRDDRGKVGSPKIKMPERLPEFRFELKHPESYYLHFITA